MPIYEYNCEKCGIVESIQKFSDAPHTDCPECGQSGVTKEISASAFHLKGTGWYKTDYGSGSVDTGSKKPAAKSTKSDGASTDSKESSSKSETKPAKACAPKCGCH